MPLTLQAKMLRVLESRGIERLGSTQFKPVDMRVIVATQTPLQKLVDEGRFRRDLYFRLDTVKSSCRRCVRVRKSFCRYSNAFCARRLPA